MTVETCQTREPQAACIPDSISAEHVSAYLNFINVKFKDTAYNMFSIPTAIAVTEYVDSVLIVL
jgi:hypothetical protein